MRGIQVAFRICEARNERRTVAYGVRSLHTCICAAKAIPRAGEFGVHSKVQANRAENDLRLERVRS